MLIYQVLPRLWGNGHFSALDEASLKYLRSLGVTHVWFTGIPRHATDKPYVKGNPGSPYAIEDYHDVNLYLADDPGKRMEEFEALVARTRRAGMEVITDLVPNHVAPECRDFVTHPYYDYDWSDTLKIDWSVPSNREALLEIVLFWASKGVRGLRCDMVELVPAEVMQDLIADVKSVHPDFIFIAEIYGRDNYRRYIDEVGFDLLYDKSGLYDALCNICMHGGSVRAITRNWQGLGDMQPRMLNFLENHDERRMASAQMLGSPERAYAALGLAALFNSAPFMLYAGQELGENAADGSDGRTSIFNFAEVPALRHLDTKLHTGKGLSREETSVLAKYRQTLKLSQSPEFLGSANYDLQYCNEASSWFDPDRHFAFLRYRPGKAWLVVCNFSDSPASPSVYIPEGLLPGGESMTLNVPVQPWDFTVIKIG